MRTLRDIRKKVTNLQLTKIEVLMELENHKEAANQKIAVLETQVQQLRNEVTEFKELLDSI